MTKTFAPAANGKANANLGTEAIATISCFSDRITKEPTDAVAFTYRGWTLALLARQLSGAVSAGDVAQFVQRARSDLAEARKLAPRYPDALAFSAINALWSQDLATAKRELAAIDALQLPADAPILTYVDGMLRPALKAAETMSSSTTVPAPDRRADDHDRSSRHVLSASAAQQAEVVHDPSKGRHGQIQVLVDRRPPDRQPQRPLRVDAHRLEHR